MWDDYEKYFLSLVLPRYPTRRLVTNNEPCHCRSSSSSSVAATPRASFRSLSCVAIATFVLICKVRFLVRLSLLLPVIFYSFYKGISFSMREGELTKFLVSFSGQIENVTFPSGVFDNFLYVQYDVVWGPDWEPVSGLSSGTSQMARAGNDPEKVCFNLPIDMVFSSTNVSGWPQLVLTVRAQNPLSGDSLRGYALALLPPITGPRVTTASLLRPQASTVLREWLAWATGRYPELVDPKMLASGKDNYLLRTESCGSVTLNLSMVSKDLRKLGYDNQPAL